MELATQITQIQSDFCMECGVCTGSCPVSRELPGFSPRQMIKRAMMDPDGELLQGHEIWSCLSCARCSSRCPVEIDFPEFIRSCRQKAREAGNFPLESHHGILQTIAGLQVRDIKQQRNMTEFLTRELPGADLSFQSSSNGVVTYHDPCRLGRGSGIYDQPRELLGLVPETKVVEMARNRENSLCCGTSAWMECSNCSKSMRVERLQEALQTGAKTLITACPKCQIHFTCAQRNAELDLKVEDLYSYLVGSIKGD